MGRKLLSCDNVKILATSKSCCLNQIIRKVGLNLVRRFSFIIILIIIITGCSVSNEDKINKLIEKTKSETFELLYQEKVKKGMIVLYKDELGFRHAFYSNKTEYWNTSGNAELSPNDGLTWGMTWEIRSLI